MDEESEKAAIIGFADDPSIDVAAKHPKDVKVYAMEIERAVGT